MSADLGSHTEADAARWEAAHAEPDDWDQPDAADLADLESACWDYAQPRYRRAA